METSIVGAAGRLMSAIGSTGRQPVVSDVVTHQTLGHGTLRGGWEGHLEVAFATGVVTFTDADGLKLLASPRLAEWQLLSQADANAELADRERLRRMALAQVRQTLSNDFLRSDSLFEAGPATHLTRAEYEQEKITFIQRWVARSQPSVNGQSPLSPDDEQSLAIATVDGNVQLVARAGSGKTETIAN